jgi:branched-chain amino acid transport system substrate-binding protein
VKHERLACRKGTLVAAMAITMGLAVGCSSASGSGSSGSGSSGSGSTYTIGFTAPLSGALALYGQRPLMVLKAEVAYVNAHGGVNGHPLKVVALDDQATGSAAGANVLQLITQYHAIVITGSPIDSECAGAAAQATAHQVPMVCQSPTASDVQPPQQYVFGVSPVQASEAEAMVDALPQIVTGAAPKIAFVANDIAGAVDWIQAATALAKAKGYQVVDSETYPVDDVDMSAIAATVYAKGPNVVFMDGTSEQHESLVRNMTTDGYKGAFFMNYIGYDYGTFQTIADPAVYGLDAASPIIPGKSTGSGATQYLEAMATQHQTSVVQLNAQSNQPAFLGDAAMIEGLKQCGSDCAGGATLAAALEKVSLNEPGFVSTWEWTPQNHVSKTTFSVVHWDPASKSLVSLQTGLPEGKI